jgi:hypothetical protein
MTIVPGRVAMLIVTVPLPLGAEGRSVVTDTDDRRRFTFWAYFGGGDRARRVPVEYQIPGHGRGFYQRHEGDVPLVLLRHDAAQPWPYGGAYLGREGRWVLDERPYRNRLLGSDHGDPVSHEEAAEILEHLGLDRALLYAPVDPTADRSRT